jgi:hypothetical protein
MSLQRWFQLWLQRQTDKLNSTHRRREHSANNDSAPWKLTLRNAPPVLYFEVQSTQSVTIFPSQTLVLPCQDGGVIYQLKGIVYVGGQHFSARLITDDCIWNYDGQMNAGYPQSENATESAFGNSDCILRRFSHLGGRAAHVYIYSFQELNPAPFVND